MIKLAVTGARGRMGQRITLLALKDDCFTIEALLERPDHPEINAKMQGIGLQTDIATAIKAADVLIDFTSPDSTMKNIEHCCAANVKLVIGTTGLTAEQSKTINAAGAKIPVVFSSNMSVGVNLLFKLTQVAAMTTKDQYKMSLTEAHHVHKKDAPSGTAKTLARLAEAASRSAVEKIDSLREGEIIGDHSIVFESPEDIITISHHAKTRDIFAKGALVAAKFLEDKSSGIYTMQDVLGLI